MSIFCIPFRHTLKTEGGCKMISFKDNDMNSVFGYVRVSLEIQNIDRQLLEMLELGIPRENIFIDKLSGKTTDRESYQQMKRHLRKGDILVIKSIDRFGRNSKDIIRDWKYFVENRKVDIVVLDMPLLDTRDRKDLLGNLISDIVLQVLSFVAQMERENISQRTREGMDRAFERGVHIGRPKIQWDTISDAQRKLIIDNYPDWKFGRKFTGVFFMEKLGLLHNTFYRIIKHYETEVLGEDKRKKMEIDYLNDEYERIKTSEENK